MSELEIYHVLCIDDNPETIKKTKNQFKGFHNIKITFFKGDFDCRFILRTTPVDLVIANIDSVNLNILDHVETIQRLSIISPPLIFHTINKTNHTDILMGNFDCSYLLEEAFEGGDILSITRQLLPDLDENYREVILVA